MKKKKESKCKRGLKSYWNGRGGAYNSASEVSPKTQNIAWAFEA